MAAIEQERIRARARHVHASARKARLVLEHIRGLPAADAQAVLEFQPRAVARDAGKVLRSAIANAADTSGHDLEDLVVAAAYADEGPTLKRWRARARGRVNRIRKRTCHITIELAVVERAEDTPSRANRRRTAAGKAPVAAPAAPVETAPAEPASEPEAAEAGVEAAPAPAPRRPAGKRTDQAAPEAGADTLAAKPKPKPRRTAKPKPAPESSAESEEATE